MAIRQILKNLFAVGYTVYFAAFMQKIQKYSLFYANMQYMRKIFKKTYK